MPQNQNTLPIYDILDAQRAIDPVNQAPIVTHLADLPREEAVSRLIGGIELDDKNKRHQLEAVLGAHVVAAAYEQEAAFQRGVLSRTPVALERMTRHSADNIAVLRGMGLPIGVASPTDKLTVTINTKPDNLGHYLDTMFTQDHTKLHPDGNTRYGHQDYFEVRKSRERTLGIAALGNSLDPNPIYGAAHGNRAWSEIVGAAPMYGKAAIFLDPNHIAHRTSFVFGDSFEHNQTLRGGLSWEDMRRLQAASESLGDMLGGSEGGVVAYHEGQIFGGLSPAAVARISIPESEYRPVHARALRELGLEDRVSLYEDVTWDTEAQPLIDIYAARQIGRPH